MAIFIFNRNGEIEDKILISRSTNIESFMSSIVLPQDYSYVVLN